MEPRVPSLSASSMMNVGPSVGTQSSLPPPPAPPPPMPSYPYPPPSMLHHHHHHHLPGMPPVYPHYLVPVSAHGGVPLSQHHPPPPPPPPPPHHHSLEMPPPGHIYPPQPPPPPHQPVTSHPSSSHHDPLLVTGVVGSHDPHPPPPTLHPHHHHHHAHPHAPPPPPPPPFHSPHHLSLPDAGGGGGVVAVGCSVVPEVSLSLSLGSGEKTCHLPPPLSLPLPPPPPPPDVALSYLPPPPPHLGSSSPLPLKQQQQLQQISLQLQQQSQQFLHQHQQQHQRQHLPAPPQHHPHQGLLQIDNRPSTHQTLRVEEGQGGHAPRESEEEEEDEEEEEEEEADVSMGVIVDQDDTGGTSPISPIMTSKVEEMLTSGKIDDDDDDDDDDEDDESLHDNDAAVLDASPARLQRLDDDGREAPLETSVSPSPPSASKSPHLQISKSPPESKSFKNVQTSPPASVSSPDFRRHFPLPPLPSTSSPSPSSSPLALNAAAAHRFVGAAFDEAIDVATGVDKDAAAASAASGRASGVEENNAVGDEGFIVDGADFEDDAAGYIDDEDGAVYDERFAYDEHDDDDRSDYAEDYANNYATDYSKKYKVREYRGKRVKYAEDDDDDEGKRETSPADDEVKDYANNLTKDYANDHSEIGVKRIKFQMALEDEGEEEAGVEKEEEEEREEEEEKEERMTTLTPESATSANERSAASTRVAAGEDGVVSKPTEDVETLIAELCKTPHQKELVARFVDKGCGCAIGPYRRACYKGFSVEEIIKKRNETLDLPRRERELLVKAHLLHMRREPKTHPETTYRDGASRKAAWTEYTVHGKKVCRRTFSFLHGMSDTTLKRVCGHYDKFGLKKREHGNAGKTPVNAVSDEEGRVIADFVLAFAKAHGSPAVPLSAASARLNSVAGLDLSMKRPHRLILPLSKKDVWLSYKRHCEEEGLRVVKLTRWRTFWPESVLTLNKADGQGMVIRPTPTEEPRPPSPSLSPPKEAESAALTSDAATAAASAAAAPITAPTLAPPIASTPATSSLPVTLHSLPVPLHSLPSALYPLPVSLTNMPVSLTTMPVSLHSLPTTIFHSVARVQRPVTSLAPSPPTPLPPRLLDDDDAHQQQQQQQQPDESVGETKDRLNHQRPQHQTSQQAQHLNLQQPEHPDDDDALPHRHHHHHHHHPKHQRQKLKMLGTKNSLSELYSSRGTR